MVQQIAALENRRRQRNKPIAKKNGFPRKDTCAKAHFLRTSSKNPGVHPNHIARGAIAINKKILIVTVVLFCLILGGELWLPLLEELVILAFEWAHKTLDVFYEDVVGLEPEATQKAAAYTGLLLLIALLAWGGRALHKKYRLFKASWGDRKAALKARWAALPWFTKLGYVVGYVGLVGILAMFL